MANSNGLNERIKREVEAHTSRDVLAESYKLKNQFPHIWNYPSRRFLHDEVERIICRLHDKVVLDYGCGRGESSLKYLKNGAMVFGIDLSPKYIAEAKCRAEQAGFSQTRYDFRVMDAHSLEFDDEVFDLVIGEGILHHLDVEIALREIHRVLKADGRLLLQEPLADNPLLKLFRILTPHARTKDEAPFTGMDIKKMASDERWDARTLYCGIIEAPVAMITSLLVPEHPDNALLRFADHLEKWFHKVGLLLSWNQYVLLDFKKL